MCTPNFKVNLKNENSNFVLTELAVKASYNADTGITQLLQLLITLNYCSNFIASLSCLIFTYIYLILPLYNVHNAYKCKLRKELSPVNLAAVTCD